MNIDDTIVVACPETRFALRSAVHCVKCQFYRGMSQAEVNGEPVESGSIEDHQILCARPITRRMTKIIT